MITTALLLVAAVGVALAAVLRLCQRSLLRREDAPAPAAWPGVAVLKPLKGVDADLAGNLRTFFRLDYPDYEILLGVRDADDPAAAVARAVAAEFPGRSARVVVDPREVGANPKVNNLANLARHATKEVFLVSDSNVAVEPGYLADLVARLEQDGVGLVSSPIRGRGGRGLGGRLEALQLDTFVMGGVAALDRVLGMPCVVGKSMLFRRADLAAIGGFSFLAGHLAEDQVCGEEIAALGRSVALAGRPVDNVIGPVTLAAFARRHVRWAKIRRRMSPGGYLGEFLLNPAPFAVAALCATPTAPVAVAAAAVVLAMAALAAASERDLGVRRPLLAYPVLELLRGLLVAALWPVPWFSDRVAWRGNEFRIGPRTRLVPTEETPLPAPRPA